MQHCSIASFRKFVPLSRHLRYTGISIPGNCRVQSSGLWHQIRLQNNSLLSWTRQMPVASFLGTQGASWRSVINSQRKRRVQRVLRLLVRSTEHVSNWNCPAPGLWCPATGHIATPLIKVVLLHEIICHNQLQNEISDGLSDTSLLC